MPDSIAAAPPRAPNAPFHWSRPARRTLILWLLVAGVIALFMTLDSRDNWGFVLPFRGGKVLAMLLVGCAIAVSTVLFQTVTHNHILSPSIMGFDALFILIQTALVYFLGASQAAAISAPLRFLLEVGLMAAFGVVLYRWLFATSGRSIHLVLLVGIILGVLFRSIASFMQRVFDPNEFAALQDMLFASFNSFDRELLGVASVTVLAVLFAVWRIRHTFDVLGLGQDAAINLGLDHRRLVALILLLITVLVSVSTALVGPVTFFGLLVASLAYQLTGTYQHRWNLPFAAGLAVLCLIGGQMIVERVFSFNTSLSIIVEFVGGIMFIILLVRGKTR